MESYNNDQSTHLVVHVTLLALRLGNSCFLDVGAIGESATRLGLPGGCRFRRVAVAASSLGRRSFRSSHDEKE